MSHRQRVAATVRGLRTPGGGGYTPVKVRWEDDGLCRQVGPFLFDEAFDDPDGTGRIVGGTTAYRHAEERREVAKTVCQVCPMVDECATAAFTNSERYGIWAGLSQIQRGKLAAGCKTVVECVAKAKARLFAEGKPLDGVDLEVEREARVAYARQQADVLRVKEAVLIEKARNRGVLRSSIRGSQKTLAAAQIAS